MSTEVNRVQWAGLFLLVGGATFLMTLHLAELTFPGYSVSLNWISDLGQSCSYAGTNWPHDCVFVQPSATIFAAGAIASGGLMLTGAYLLYPRPRFRRLSLLVGVVGAGSIGLAFFPEGVPLPHGAFAALALLFGALAAVESVRLVPRVLGIVFLVLASVSLAAFAILVTVGGGTVAPTWTPLGKGGMERMVVYPELLWDVAFGTTLMGLPESVAEPSRRSTHARADVSGPSTAPAGLGGSDKPPT